ncbi:MULTISPECIES: DUF2218 domain-containing protein [Actinokineospora]|uniref:DUF2218 domain-containing protein n=2 Tax=Actinokineospora TaxID=39845 RepID=A0A421B1M1_9PSEU|nr:MULTISPECIES: DUF2218 domain-containing protein [Actinokineospora]RLK58242.1 hypothetical protein CLV68_4338 [Actinokineospora cianjurensis]SER01338.1 hypothetical protein SAMN04487818_101283 [Actinokineospora terrae]
MATSSARVVTDRPGRYAKQLAAHMARKVDTSWDADTGVGELRFPFGTSSLVAEPDALLLTVDGAAEDLERLEAVVGKHLVRFGAKDELVVLWSRSTGEAGTEWRHSGDE